MMDFNTTIQNMIERAVSDTRGQSIEREESIVRMSGGKEYISRRAACIVMGIGRESLQKLIDNGALTETDIGIRTRDIAHIPSVRRRRLGK